MTRDNRIAMDLYVPLSTIVSLADGLDGDLGKTLAYPYTALGLSIGGVGMLLDIIDGNVPLVTGDYNAINFIDNPAADFVCSIFGAGAMTFGNTVIYGNGMNPENTVWSYNRPNEIPYPVKIGRHEENHTYQYQYVGLIYPLIYFSNGPGEGMNFMEKNSDVYGAWSNQLNWRGR